MIDLRALPPVVKVLTTPATDNITRQACFVIAKITAGTRDQLQVSRAEGLHKPLSSLLNCQDAPIFLRLEALDILKSILRTWEEEKNLGSREVFAKTVLEAGDMDESRILWNHQTCEIREIAAKLVRLFGEMVSLEVSSGLEFGENAPKPRIPNLCRVYTKIDARRHGFKHPIKTEEGR
ncbi:Importin subunit alpha-1b-like protein [Drosera capensis]